MDYQTIAYYNINSDFIQIKFVANLDVATIIDENFVLQDTQATPNTYSDAFESIVLASDFSSISRMLTLWWKTKPATGDYCLRTTNLKTYLNEVVSDAEIEFAWVNSIEDATPASVDEALRPSREPIDTEDYSIKSISWSEETSSISSDSSPNLPATTLNMIDLAPGTQTHHQVRADENGGRIDFLFDSPIIMNYASSIYFPLSKKKMKKGLSQWIPVQTQILVSIDSKIVSILLPTTNADGNIIYSDQIAPVDIPNYVFFEPGYKYKVVLSTLIGA
jgi:hypothetical protein